MNKIAFIIIPLSIILLAGILFLSTPTSIFGEASDINHDQRDETLISLTKSKNYDFATTTGSLVTALDSYRSFWNDVDEKYPETKTNISQTASGSPIATITDEEFELISAIITQEAGDTYEGALAVATCVVNRIAEGTWNSSWDRQQHLADTRAGEKDPLAILTASGQFAAYIDYDYLKYVGNVPENVKRAVIDCFTAGKRNHNYTCFRSYRTTNSVNIEGNWFFAPFNGDTSTILYDISSTSESGEPAVSESPEITNTDPGGEENWDILYLIAAYDASKNNLEGKVEDKDGNPISRYQDLLYGIGEYIIKACFGTEVEVERDVIEEVSYPVYESTEIFVMENNTIRKETVYKETGEAKTKIRLVVPLYEPEEVTEILGYSGETEVEVSEADESHVKISENLYEKKSSQYFKKTDDTKTLEPVTRKVKEKIRVRGLQKSVLLSVLGLNPGDPYKVTAKSDFTNADYIEYARESMIKILSVEEGEYAFDGKSISNLKSGEWVWPLDPNGANVYVITSLMGTRESPGGIGSTNHAGTDIGASYGVAILAANSGTVEIAGVYGGYGNCVRITHDPNANGDVYESIYGHMSRIATTPGAHVQAGEIIGYVGSTGRSTGPHLHFEVHRNGEVINGLSLYDDSILNRLTYP